MYKRHTLVEEAEGWEPWSVALLEKEKLAIAPNKANAVLAVHMCCAVRGMMSDDG